MREIKFRAWNKRDKVMEYDVNVNQGKPVKQGCQWFNTENTETVYHSALQQYTGLKDKNGKEIYEGDVLKNDYGDLWVVVWNGIGFKLALFGDSKGIYSANEYYFSSCEVIGNIYEHPHLLEAKGNE